jgi:hypothetical protein
MNESIEIKLELINLKEKLSTQLKLFCCNKKSIDFALFNSYLDTQKIKYQTNNDILQFLNNITNHLNNLISNINDESVNNFISLLYINELNNKHFIKELLKFVNTAKYYELEDRIEKLEKEIIEIKNISLSQNLYLERIDENTK